jgi:hypothetical protein
VRLRRPEQAICATAMTIEDAGTTGGESITIRPNQSDKL